MAIFTDKVTADGWFLVSTGAAQIQITEDLGEAPIVGILHASSAPSASDPHEFQIAYTDIHYALGTIPCYLKVLSGGTVTISAVDIS